MTVTVEREDRRVHLSLLFLPRDRDVHTKDDSASSNVTELTCGIVCFGQTSNIFHFHPTSMEADDGFRHHTRAAARAIKARAFFTQTHPSE